MKIVFLCGCLEPGHDGVGDYTRLLTAKLIYLGHDATIISLNDKYVADIFVDGQQIDDIVIKVLRLPSAYKFKDRIKTAKAYIEKFDPDWISLQFVIFGYHSKGLPFGISKNIARLGKGKQWHIMFHELWLGMEANVTMKHLLWGKLQRLLIKNLINTLQPKIIHTHTGLYQQQIQKLGFEAHHLSLFGNIPKVTDPENQPEKISVGKINNLKFVIFGTIFTSPSFEDFIREITLYIKETDISVNLTFIGRCGAEQELWVKKFVEAGIQVIVLGELSPNDISKELSNSTMGISTYPAVLVEKSGSIAAMLEHGLPVICIQPNWHPKNYSYLDLPFGIRLYEKGKLKSLLSEKIDLPITNSLSTTAHKFAETLLRSI